MSRRYLWFQLGAILGAVGLYLLGRLLFLPHASGAAARYFGWYHSDILAGAMILGITNLLLPLAQRGWRLDRAWSIGLFLLVCGLAWECLPLFYKAGAVFDWYDLLAYFIGGGGYYLAGRAAGVF